MSIDATSLVYNGYAFSPRSHVKVSESMVYDDADRTAKYNRILIRVDTIVVADANMSMARTMNDLRARLSKPGQPLTLYHPGFGTELRVNSAKSDVAFGPKPRVLQWDPVGHTQAVEIVWECEVHLPACQDGRTQGVAGFNYSVAYDIDDHGFTTRSIDGSIEIAMTRAVANNRQIPDTADRYRRLLKIAKPKNFKRKHRFAVSADKRTLDFNIVDTEIRSPRPYPPGVVDIDAKHRIGWKGRGSSNVIRNAITASITLAANQPALFAWEIFRRIVLARTSYAQQLNQHKHVFMESIDIEESLFGFTHNFALTYRLTGGVSEIFTGTGVLQDLPTEPRLTWDYWNDSMKPIQNDRGLAKMEHHPQDDVIVDLCMNQAVPNNAIDTQGIVSPYVNAQKLCNKRPPRKESWLRFEASLRYIQTDSVAVQIQLGQSDLTDKEFDPSKPGENFPEQKDGQIERFIEQAAPMMEWEYKGFAERAGYEIPMPHLLRIGRVVLKRKDRGVFEQKMVGERFCVKVFQAAWKFRYTVLKIEPPKPGDADPVNQPPGRA